MSLLQAIILGAVQGLTEYLPISSSGHLALVPFLVGWEPQSQAFDLALHLGTALSLLWFFRAEWLALVRGFLSGLASPATRADDPAWRLSLYVLLGSLPAGVLGILLEDTVERVFRNPVLIATMLILFSFVILAADRLGRRRRAFGEVTLADALLVGLLQAVALVPGVSRSGITISAGLARGLTREAAARFSFLLSGPIIVAAAVFKLRHGIPGGELGVVLAGVVSSALVGWLAVGLLLRYLQRNSLLVFVVERLLVGLLTLALALGRG